MTSTLRKFTALAVSVLLLAGCGGGGGDDDADDEVTPSPTPSPTETLPPGVDLTTPGTELSFGEIGTVEFSASQKLTTYLAFTVRDATRGRLTDLKGFALDTPYKRNANYYFVNVDVENVGEGDLGGRDVPLAGVNQEGTLLPPVVFQSAFPKCPSGQLPKPFGAGAVFSTCLVFLSPDKGQLTAVSTLTDGTVEPVTWTGEVQDPPPVKKPNKKQPKRPRRDGRG